MENASGRVSATPLADNGPSRLSFLAHGTPSFSPRTGARAQGPIENPGDGPGTSTCAIQMRDAYRALVGTPRARTFGQGSGSKLVDMESELVDLGQAEEHN